MYVVVIAGLTLAEVIEHVLHAERSMDDDQANARTWDTPILVRGAADERELRLIIGEAVVRNDWVSTSGDPEDEPLAVAAIIGPTSGAGPELLKLGLPK
jgi:hypothetical protein